MDASATAASSREKRKHRNEDNQNDETSTKRSQPNPSKKTLAGCSKSIDSIEQVSVYTAVTKHGHRGTLLIGNAHESLAMCIDLAQVIRESDPTGHLAQTLKDAKITINKKIDQGPAQQNDLLTQKVNLIESELSGLRSEMARPRGLVIPENDLLTQKVNLIESDLSSLRNEMTQKVNPMEFELSTLRSEIARLAELVETGASTIKYPKPTSTHQAFRGHENRSPYRDHRQPAPFSSDRENPDRRHQEENPSYRQASEARVAPSNRLPASDTTDSTLDECVRASIEDWHRKNRPQSHYVSFNPGIPYHSSNAPPHTVYPSQANLRDNPAPFRASIEQQDRLQNIERGWEHRRSPGYDSSSPMPGRQRNQSDRGSDTPTVIRPAYDHGLRSRKFDGSSDLVESLEVASEQEDPMGGKT